MFKKVLIGLMAGIISGLFSTGGGMILVPAFVYLLNLEDKKARGTSVFCILPMVVTSSFFYYKENFINWKIAILCAIRWSTWRIFGCEIIKKGATNYIKDSICLLFSICIF